MTFFFQFKFLFLFLENNFTTIGMENLIESLKTNTKLLKLSLSSKYFCFNKKIFFKKQTTLNFTNI